MRYWTPPPDEEARHTGRGIGFAVLITGGLIALALLVSSTFGADIEIARGVCPNGIPYVAYFVPRKAIQIAAQHITAHYRIDALALRPNTIWVARDVGLSRSLLAHECRHLAGEVHDVDERWIGNSVAALH